MKKLSIFLAGLVAVFGLASCENEKEPVYKAPTTFELNVPVMENQYLELNEENTFELVASAQPDYGYSAVTTYSALVSLTPDFKETYEMRISDIIKSYETRIEDIKELCETRIEDVKRCCEIRISDMRTNYEERLEDLRTLINKGDIREN